MLGSCKYDDVLPEELVDIDPTDSISFSDDVMPIFNASCNISGCHDAGGTDPDLTPANAYDALFNGGYIDLTTPENSELYQWMVGNRKFDMPLEGPNANYNATVLLWIQQGAQEN